MKYLLGRCCTQRLALSGLALLGVLTLLAVLVPWCSPPIPMQLPLHNLPPSQQFWFGTDALGEDLFTNCWHGARTSLIVAIVSTAIDLVIGVLYGSIAGICGGKIEEWMMRVTDIFSAIPHLPLVILLILLCGPSLLTVILALSLAGWINMARIVRARVIQVKEMEFIRASQVLGASPLRILCHHILPNTCGVIVVTASFTIPKAIFAEAFLSFLGLGVPSPHTSWGVMINQGLPALSVYPWRVFFPALCVSITVLAFNLISDGLQEALDTRVTP